MTVPILTPILTCYTERNPVRARMVRKAWRYRWSSAAAHCGSKNGNGLVDLGLWRSAWTAEQWREKLSRPEEEGAVSGVRANTYTGRPLGSDAFLSKVESLMGRRIRPLPIGRPKKVVEEEENR